MGVQITRMIGVDVQNSQGRKIHLMGYERDQVIGAVAWLDFLENGNREQAQTKEDQVLQRMHERIRKGGR